MLTMTFSNPGLPKEYDSKPQDGWAQLCSHSFNGEEFRKGPEKNVIRYQCMKCRQWITFEKISYRQDSVQEIPSNRTFKPLPWQL